MTTDPSIPPEDLDYEGDQDAEPTLTAPESGRPDNLVAAKDDEQAPTQAEADPGDDS